jgi:hypothetical protein
MHWSLIALLAACNGSSNYPEHWAVGTYLFTGTVLTGATDCKYEAPPGVLDGSLVLKPGTITETCPSGYKSTITAEYTDHIALMFPPSVELGNEAYFSFELRNASDIRLTPTLAQMGIVKLADGCTALTEPDYRGAQDTGHSPFMVSRTVARGSCKVSIDVELPIAGGKKTFHAEQTVTVK